MTPDPAAAPATLHGFVGSTVQIAFVTDDLHRTLDGLVGLGIGPFSLFTMGPDNCPDLEFRGAPSRYSVKIAFAVHEGMMWEVIQPLEGESLFTEALAAGHQGLHHVAVDCNGASVADSIGGLEERGWEVVTRGTAFHGQVPFAYLTNGDASGPVLEVFSFPEGFAPEPEGLYPG